VKSGLTVLWALKDCRESRVKLAPRGTQEPPGFKEKLALTVRREKLARPVLQVLRAK